MVVKASYRLHLPGVSMKRIVVLVVLAVLSVGWARDNTFSLQLETGWFNGLSGEAGLALFNILGEPFGVRLGVGFAATDPFVNSVSQAAGITLDSESGSNLTLGLDFSYSLDFQSAFTLSPYAGARYNLFSGQARSGVNTYQATSNQLGLGAGLRAGYYLDSQFSLLADFGLDYFFPGNAQLNTTPPGVNANDWVSDPSLVFKARIGLAFNF